MEVPIETVRDLAVIKQGLDNRPESSGKNALLSTIKKIGLLQLDTINVVARSHYLVMLSRHGLYKTSDLDSLLYPDRLLFEQWAHVASLMPMEYYSYFEPMILSRRKEEYRRLKQLGRNPKKILTEVMDRVEKEGALSSRHFENVGKGRSGWWDWKPHKVALEVLFRQGYLMIDKRVNFQRHYNLSERVIPTSIAKRHKTLDEWREWSTLKALSCLGVATAKEVADYYRQDWKTVTSSLNKLVGEERVLQLNVKGVKEPAYVSREDLGLLENIKKNRHKSNLTTFLSPFDNLIWSRERVRRLFDFHYRVDMYNSVAKKKRVYGYYVMPILHNGMLVGRIDPKMDRQNKTLLVHNIYLEGSEKMRDGLVDGIAGALQEFMRFNNGKRIVIEKSQPGELKKALKGALKSF